MPLNSSCGLTVARRKRLHEAFPLTCFASSANSIKAREPETALPFISISDQRLPVSEAGCATTSATAPKAKSAATPKIICLIISFPLFMVHPAAGAIRHTSDRHLKERTSGVRLAGYCIIVAVRGTKISSATIRELRASFRRWPRGRPDVPKTRESNDDPKDLQ